MRAVLLVSLALVLGSCGGSEPPGARSSSLDRAPEPGDEPGSTRASREGTPPIAAAGDTSALAPSSASALPDARPLFIARAIDAPEGEDGHGATIPADRPIALELDAHRFPPRALDPVLLVGSLRFVHYDHPAPGRVRFVVASRALLPEGATVAVQYGDDASTRTIVSESLALPPEGAR